MAKQQSQWEWGDTPSQSATSSPKRQQQPRPQTETEGDRKTGKNTKLIFNLLKFALFLGIGVVVWFNVQPYIGIIRVLNQGTDPSFWNWLSRIPVVGSIMRFFDEVWYHIWGCSMWAIFQLGELLPVILGTKTALKRTIVSFANAERMEVKTTDSAVVSMMKKQLNDAPKRWLSHATAIASICYILDFGICMVYYPPVKNLSVFMASPSLDQIDLRNCVFIVFTVIAVEAAVWLWNWLNQGIEYLQLRSENGSANGGVA